MNKKNKNTVKKSLDMLLNDDISLDDNVELPIPDSAYEPLDYIKVKKTSENKAKQLMVSLLNFYLSEELINENEYIRVKSKFEVMTMSMLINQIQIAEHAIMTLMQTIESGELSARMFEVLAGLQKTMLELINGQTLHMLSAEENMKRMKATLDIYGKNEPKQIDEISESNTSTRRGTRDLMKEIRDELDAEDL